MPKKAHNDQLGDGSMLMKAVRESEAELPGVCRYMATLDQAYARVVKSRGRRSSLVASAQEATRRMNACAPGDAESCSCSGDHWVLLLSFPASVWPAAPGDA